jgi:hypothetical protein
MSVRAEIIKIQEKHGKLTPRLILNEVKGKPKHPLYHRFEWDDRLAGEKYRLQQARLLIIEVDVLYEDQEGKSRPIREWYQTRASDTGEPEYDRLENIMADAFRRKLLMSEMERRIAELVATYERLDEFWDLMRKVSRQTPRKKRKAG